MIFISHSVFVAVTLVVRYLLCDGQAWVRNTLHKDLVWSAVLKYHHLLLWVANLETLWCYLILSHLRPTLSLFIHRSSMFPQAHGVYLLKTFIHLFPKVLIIWSAQSFVELGFFESGKAHQAALFSCISFLLFFLTLNLKTAVLTCRVQRNLKLLNDIDMAREPIETARSSTKTNQISHWQIVNYQEQVENFLDTECPAELRMDFCRFL